LTVNTPLDEIPDACRYFLTGLKAGIVMIDVPIGLAGSPLEEIASSA
jgi:hypothetical protein